MSYNTISDITVTILWLGFFSAILLSFYFYLRFRNKERMALIEKGVDVSEIFKQRDLKFKFPWLKVGMLLLGVGFGVLVSVLVFGLVPSNFFKSNTEPFFLISSVLIFGAIGIIIGDCLERRRDKKNG